LSKSCQKVQNSTNSGGWGCGWGGEIVVPRPSASASLTGQRQKDHVTSLKPSLGTLDPGLKMQKHLCIIFLYLFTQCNCSACNVPPGAGLQKRANFSTLIIGLAGTLFPLVPGSPARQAAALIAQPFTMTLYTVINLYLSLFGDAVHIILRWPMLQMPWRVHKQI
jgi:hypothetical protein